MQLPEFQRSWVWDEDRIKSLIASVSQEFPIGAIMTLQTGGDVRFKERPIQGASDSANDTEASYLLLDGQQRITSLFQVLYRDAVTLTVTARKKRVERWFYIDILAALDTGIDRESTIIGIPRDRTLRKNFGRDIELDLSSPDREYHARMFPLNRVFDSGNWGRGYFKYWLQTSGPESALQENERFSEFQDKILKNFSNYHIPTIEMPKSTPREAVCLVFEKVNTGGKPLDVFELVTATYAADGFDLREDWLGDGGRKGRQNALSVFGRESGQQRGLLEGVSSTDFLQAISLVATRRKHLKDIKQGKNAKDATPVSATRQSLLRMPLRDYKKYADTVQIAFEEAAKFLRNLNIFRSWDIPYKSQLVPLAAILAETTSYTKAEPQLKKLTQWYWCGVFGELYGSATETRFAKDVAEVPHWLSDSNAPEPTTISDAVFREDRLQSLQTRQSAAYKGVNALLMGSRKMLDWRNGKTYNSMTFHEENVDIHHIFPAAWFSRNHVSTESMNSILNKTPLSATTNRILGGEAPSKYLSRLESGVPNKNFAIDPDRLDVYLESHYILPHHLRKDDFEVFLIQRKKAMVDLIQKAMNKEVFRGSSTNEPEEDVHDEDESPI